MEKVISKKVTTQSGDTCIFNRLRTNYKIQPNDRTCNKAAEYMT